MVLRNSFWTIRGYQLNMQNRSFLTSATSSQTPQAKQSVSAVASVPNASSGVSDEQLVRVFNTSIVSTKAGKKRDFSSEIYALTESSSFKAILSSVRQLSRVQGISEREAAEEVIQTFRKMDELWGEYVFKEGIDKLRNLRR